MKVSHFSGFAARHLFPHPQRKIVVMLWDKDANIQCEAFSRK
jgi:hypothetical protein